MINKKVKITTPHWTGNERYEVVNIGKLLSESKSSFKIETIEGIILEIPRYANTIITLLGFFEGVVIAIKSFIKSFKS
jgi:uncharacterized membrane protein YheB (UPF0754 family)